MKRLIPILFILATFNGWLHGQVTQPPGVILVGTAPSGACTAGVQGQMVTSTGAIWTCQSGTWATVGGGGGSTAFNALTSGTNSTAAMVVGSGASLTYSGTGSIVGSPTPLTTGTSVTLTGPRQYFICTGACAITVPVPVAGYEFCVQNNVAVTSVITFAAIGSSARYGKTDQSAYGTAGTGTFVSGGAAGDKMCLLGIDATHYNVAAFNGTWTAN